MRLTLVSCRIEQIVYTTHIKQKSVIKRLQSFDVHSLNPFFGSTPLLLPSSSLTNIGSLRTKSMLFLLTFWKYIENRIWFAFNLSEHLYHLALKELILYFNMKVHFSFTLYNLLFISQNKYHVLCAIAYS